MGKINEDMEVGLKEYREALEGGLFDAEEVDSIITEMKEAKVGTLKADCWEKLDDDRYLIFFA